MFGVPLRAVLSKAAINVFVQCKFDFLMSPGQTPGRRDPLPLTAMLRGGAFPSLRTLAEGSLERVLTVSILSSPTSALPAWAQYELEAHAMENYGKKYPGPRSLNGRKQKSIGDKPSIVRVLETFGKYEAAFPPAGGTTCVCRMLG